MLKNACLSIKKNSGKTILLFVIMAVIANLIIAGLSIQSASEKSMQQIRSSLGNDVTLSTNMKNMMQSREKGQAVQEVQSSITTTMADQLIGLEHVDSYSYNISTDAYSDTLTPVELESSTTQVDPGGMRDSTMETIATGDFTIEANSSMENNENFTSESYELIEGRLLSESDFGTNNCVIETNLASDNDIVLGDTISVYTTVDDVAVTQELSVVGIYQIGTSTTIGGPSRSNPINTIFTDLSVGQTLTGSTTDLSSVTYYLDDPENIEAFIADAKANSDIDFDTYTLDANDQLYQRNVSSLENTQYFATMFLLVVIIAGSVILGLILVLTIRGRFYEIGVFLSLGQSKLKIIGQQLFEIGIIAAVAFVISLGTGKMVSNVISGMLVQGESSNTIQMEMPGSSSTESETSDSASSERTMPSFDNAFSSPENTELDVSLTGSTVVQLAAITLAICVVSTMIPSVYILRLSPREILVKKEG